MNESEWLACNALDRLLKEVRERASDRKLRLLACAFAHRVWDRIAFEETRQAVEIAEQVAEGTRSDWAFIRARNAVRSRLADSSHEHIASVFLGVGMVEPEPIAAARSVGNLALDVLAPQGTPGRKTLQNTERRVQCDLLRDFLGDHLLPATIDPAWLDWKGGLIPELAQAIYEERAFDRLPYLGDALEAAGCTHPAILSHCHQGGEHARGCWVVDALLGKT